MKGKRPVWLIGIDCGVTTGFSVYECPATKLHICESVKIHNALDRVKSWWNWHGDTGLLVRIEDARLRTWIPKMPDESRERGRREGAGSVKRDAVIWEDFLTEFAIPFQLVAPKDNKTKLTDDAFRRMTGFQGRTNEHARDSALLVWGF